MKEALGNLWWRIRTEPVIVANSLTAVIAAGVGFGIYDAGDSQQWAGVAAAVIVAIGTLFGRAKVTPAVKLDRLEPDGYAGEGIQPVPPS